MNKVYLTGKVLGISKIKFDLQNGIQAVCIVTVEDVDKPGNRFRLKFIDNMCDYCYNYLSIGIYLFVNGYASFNMICVEHVEKV